MTAPRVLFYVQHLLGIGHLARASRIAQAMAQDGMAVTLVTGGLPVAGFPGAGVDHVALPAIASGSAGFADLVDANGAPVDAAFKADRAQKLLETYHRIQPDVILIEAFPFGRRQVRFELLPLLQANAAQPHPALVLSSVRDILQENRKPGRNEETLALVRQYFDAVLVHGDPAFIRLTDSFPLADQIADKIRYTGLVAPPAPTPAQDHWDVVVSAGGGAVGADLIRTALAAQKRLDPRLRWCLITGPNMPQADFDAAQQATSDIVQVCRFRTDFAQLLAAAQVSVSQAGYNTVCDILQAGCRAVLVPYAAGGETEQTTRAAHLPAQVVSEADLTEETLARAIQAALSTPAMQVPKLDLNGAQTSARIIRAMLAP